MEPNSARWITVSDSRHDHEREALAWLRRRLPDRDPVRVWSNFEFVTRDGRLYEVDALVVTEAGVFVVEVKSHPGAIGGDAGTWTWRRPDGSVGSFDNPRSLASSKAKALKDRLLHAKAFAKHRNEVPFVTEVVFLSDPDLEVTLSEPARHQVFGRDAEPGEDLPPQRAAIGGVVEYLTSLERNRQGYLRRVVDRPLGERLARAVDQIGIRERSGRRRVGDYEVGELLVDVDADVDTGVAYQEFLADHVSTRVQQRMRLYPLELNATTEQREAATRAARWEFELLAHLDHPGILKPTGFTEHERGPVLFFHHDPDAVSLDRWLARPDVVDAVDMGGRLSVLRQVAEAVRHANERGVYHRALCPAVVMVSGPAAEPRVRVTGWHAGARVSTGTVTGTVSGTVHVDELAAGHAALYRAPEFDQPNAHPASLDVFSLGCLAAYIFTGQHPASTITGLLDQLTQLGHVGVDADGLDDLLAVLVMEATLVDPDERLGSAAELLAELDGVEEKWTLPDPVDEPHPLAAVRGQSLGEGRFEVLHRLGSGSTSVALLVKDTAAEGRVCVLKVAKELRFNEWLADEAAALDGLVHPGIVRLYDGPLDLDGHNAIVISYVGPKVDGDQGPRGGRTLAERIAEGVGVELQERFGEDLLDAVRYLEDMGVAHRDIKPENLGVAPRGERDELHVVLFDFSLSRAPLDRVDAGTAGYLDPFLRRPGRGRWDPAAERYAVAVVLHELCTGTRPRYGDGSADPALVDADLDLDPERFEPSVAAGLTRFFATALAPDVADRHGTAADMLWAWRQAFRAAAEPAGTTAHPEQRTLPAGTTLDSPLAGLGVLSNRALAALDAIDATTVGDLIGLPANRVTQLRGEGARTRREITEVAAWLRDELPADELLDAPDAPLAAIAERLVPRPARADSEGTTATLRRLVGLDGDPGRWPTNAELADAQGVSRQRVSQIVAKGRARWVKQPPITAVRQWIADELDATSGVAAVRQLAARLARARPPIAAPLDDAEHLRHATAVLRAALLAEEERADRRWVLRRFRSGRAVVATDTLPDVPGNALADHAAALAARTEALLADEPVVSRVALLAALRDVPVPDGATPLPDAHLAELAAALAPSAAVNTRLELYRQGLDPADAVAAARRALTGVDDIDPDRVRAKIRSRFPQAAPLPDRPALDDLLTAAGVDLVWSDGSYRSAAALDASASLTHAVSRVPTGATSHATPAEIDVAADFDARLTAATDHGGLLVLVTDGRHLDLAADQLSHHAATTVDVDEWLLAEIERLTEGGRPRWETVVAADAAGPGSPQWTNLTRLVDRAVDALTDRLLDTTGTVLLTHAGLLARYDRLDAVARWRDALHTGDRPLRALWLLVSSGGAVSDVPLLDHRPVPVISRNEWARIPTDWLRNLHRARATP